MKLFSLLFLLGPAAGQIFMQPGGIGVPAGPVVPNIQELPLYKQKRPENSLIADFDLPRDSYVEPDPFLTSLKHGYWYAFEECFNSVWAKAQDPQTRLTWFLSMLGCVAVVMCGILPVVLLPIETGDALHRKGGLKKLNLLLSFAVGSLLGDVFLHILPETFSSCAHSYDATVGLWLITGLLMCFLVEKICAKSEESQHTVTAVMNLIANLIDNFTHGLAVAGSFTVSVRFGLVTTFAILVHEVPHEISDFAILLRADYNRWSAVKAQLFTASGGILGATLALAVNSDSVGAASTWILPFTAGGFLNIALVQVLPDLIKERNSRESLKQLFFILLGIMVMGVVNTLHFV